MHAFDAHDLACLRQGLADARAGDYFAAHDAWEEVWQGLSGHRRMFWQAMIQLVVGGYHYGHGNVRGCQGQWHKALQKCVDLLPRYPEPGPVPLTALQAMLLEGLTFVERGDDPLPHLQHFARTVLSEEWFSFV